MKKRYILMVIFAFGLSITSCNGKTEETKKEEVKTEDEISDEEFEKEMQELDEDVENMESGTAEEQAQKSAKEDEKVVEKK